MLYSWRFSCFSMPIHWLVHGHMTSNNETVSRQMPWAGNVAKTVTSNRKQFTVTHEMVTAVACDQRWPDVVVGISACFSKFAFVLFCYVTNHLMNINVSLNFILGNIEILWKQTSLLPLGPVIKCFKCNIGDFNWVSSNQNQTSYLPIVLLGQI